MQKHNSFIDSDPQYYGMIKIILVAAPLDNLGINYVLTKAGYCLRETKKGALGKQTYHKRERDDE